jgi:hypothetical protein
MTTETRIVDNRVFLLGLDELYRDAMKAHERTELLGCAQATADTLRLSPADVPIEGYYTEDDELARYFRLVRAIQKVPRHRESELQSHDGYARLKQVAGSPVFGPSSDEKSLLPAGNDCLTVALGRTFPSWTIETITDKAYEVAVQSNDYSIVALAALSHDPVVLAALRESVVLYAVAMAGCAMIEQPQYDWRVDNEVSTRASRFITEFNDLLSEALPEPLPSNADTYWTACQEWKVIGRCVRIGFDDSIDSVKYYHWAIDQDSRYDLVVKDFWDTDIWTTERYREAHEERL